MAGRLEMMLANNSKRSTKKTKKTKKRSKTMSQKKARKIVAHGTLRGKRLSEISDRQRRFIFARANLA